MEPPPVWVRLPEGSDPEQNDPKDGESNQADQGHILGFHQCVSLLDVSGPGQVNDLYKVYT